MLKKKKSPKRKQYEAGRDSKIISDFIPYVNYAEENYVDDQHKEEE